MPLDGSALAEEAIGPATVLARAWPGELRLIQVVSPVLTLMDQGMSLPSSYDTKLTESLRAMAQDYLGDHVEQLHRAGLRASGAAVVGWEVVISI